MEAHYFVYCIKVDPKVISNRGRRWFEVASGGDGLAGRRQWKKEKGEELT